MLHSMTYSESFKCNTFPPTAPQLQRPPARPHLIGDEERAVQASPPRAGREGLQTRLLRGRPAGETHTQVHGPGGGRGV